MEWTANIERHLIGTTDSKRILTYFMKTINDSAPTKEKELDLAAPESNTLFHTTQQRFACSLPLFCALVVHCCYYNFFVTTLTETDSVSLFITTLTCNAQFGVRELHTLVIN